MRYQFVEGHRDRWPARLMCAVLGVPPGGYYGWRRRPASPRRQRREDLVVAIEAVRAGSKARYGGPRSHAELVARGRPCGVTTVAALTRRHGIAAETRRKSRRTTDSDRRRPVAEDLVGRPFEPEAANRTRTADIASVPTREGWPDLAAVEGLHSREIVGRSMSERIAGRPVVDAPEMAVARRLPGEGLVAHSGRGSQYAGEHYRRLLASRGITCGMSRRGGRRDSAPMGSSFASLKEELVHGADFATRAAARAEWFEYIEVFYDRVRRHSAPGYRSPGEYERAA